MRGKFIAFDGLDGCGKGTQIALYAEYLRAQGETVLVLPSLDREGYSGIVRQAIVGDIGAQMHPLPRQMFIAAAYMHTYHTRILPALERGETVLLDRYTTTSTVAYGAADGVSIDTMTHLTEIILSASRAPDMCIIIDVPYEVAMQRIHARGAAQEISHFDLPSEKKFNARRGWLLTFAQRYPWSWRVNGTGTREHVAHLINRLPN